MSQTLAAASSFSLSRAYPSLSFLPALFLRLTPYSDYAEVNIFPNDSFSLSFLIVYASPICSSTKDSRTNFFSPSILPSYVEAVEFFALPLPQKKDRFQLPLPASASLVKTDRHTDRRTDTQTNRIALYWLDFFILENLTKKFMKKESGRKLVEINQVEASGSIV